MKLTTIDPRIPRGLPLTLTGIVCALLVVLGVSACTEAKLDALSADDVKAVRRVSRAYGAGWLSNDAERVMAVFSDDATIIPSGMEPIRGDAAMRAFWFPPDSPPTRVTAFESTEYEVSGHGRIAVVTGTFKLEFEYDGKPYASGGSYLNVLKRQFDGAWLITHRMWNDHR